MSDEPTILFLCINLERDTERRARFEAQSAGLPGDVILLEAIDGRVLDAVGAEGLGYDRRARRIAHDKELTDNEIACAGSHRKALTTFLASPHEFGVILEDDVVLEADFGEKLMEVITRTHGWDAVKLECRDPKRPGLTLCRLPAGGRLTAAARPGLGTTAMLYTREGASKVLRMTESFCTGFDTELNAHWRHGIVIAQTQPPLARPDDGIDSSIGTRTKQQSPRGWQARLDKLGHSIGKRVFMLKTRRRVRCD
jgi:glycosyl transferase family 25